MTAALIMRVRRVQKGMLCPHSSYLPSSNLSMFAMPDRPPPLVRAQGTGSVPAQSTEYKQSRTARARKHTPGPAQTRAPHPCRTPARLGGTRSQFSRRLLEALGCMFHEGSLKFDSARGHFPERRRAGARILCHTVCREGKTLGDSHPRELGCWQASTRVGDLRWVDTATPYLKVGRPSLELRNSPHKKKWGWR